MPRSPVHPASAGDPGRADWRPLALIRQTREGPGSLGSLVMGLSRAEIPISSPHHQWGDEAVVSLVPKGSACGRALAPGPKDCRIRVLDLLQPSLALLPYLHL